MSMSECLQQLVSTFYRDVNIARNLESNNPEDDLAIKAAVVGFSYNSPTQEWGKNHYDFLKNRLDQDYRNDDMIDYGHNGQNVKLFFALSIGYLLGLYQQDKINEAEFRLAEVQIPGLIMLHLSTLTEQTA